MKKILHQFFKISILIKGIDGALEILGGIFLSLVSPLKISALILWLTRHELAEDPKDFIANYLTGIAHNLSLNAQFFGALYLLSHGLIKIILISSLWKRRLWAYPISLIFFFLFCAYQIYRYNYSHEIWLIILTIFDVFVILLTWMEWKRLKQEFN